MNRLAASPDALDGVVAILSLERREARKPRALFIELPLWNRPRVRIVCRPSEQRRLFEDVLEDPRRGELTAEAFQLVEDWTE